MCHFEIIGFADPDLIERDLKKRFAGTSYYDKLVYIPQKKMAYYLETDNTSPHLRISVNQLLEEDELIDVFLRLDRDYTYHVLTMLSVPKGKTVEEIMLEAALRAMPQHP